MELFEDKKEVTLPMKRTKATKATEEKPVLKKKPVKSDSESDIDDSYLDDLEARLEKKLGPGSNFDDVIFMKSPHDSIFSAEGISSDRFKTLTTALSTLPDGEELIHFAEFLTSTKA